MLNKFDAPDRSDSVLDPTDIWIRKSLAEEADALAALTIKEVGTNTASAATIRTVIQHNGQCIFSVLRSRPGPIPSEIIGFYAYLPLNSSGVTALLEGRFDGTNPCISMISRPEDRPAAIYGWVAVARGFNKFARPLVMQHMAGRRYSDLPFYARAATTDGVRAMRRFGCVPASSNEQPGIGCLFVGDFNSIREAA